jgi:hypothetical protein
MDYLFSIAKNERQCRKNGTPKLFFFNSSFDCSFILDYLMKNGFGEREGEKGVQGYFTTNVTELGVMYSVDIFFRDALGYKNIKLKDARHNMGGSIKLWGKKLGFPKGETPIKPDNLPSDYEPTESEIEYCKQDVRILKKGFMGLRERGMNKDTQASNALLHYKKILHGSKKGMVENTFRNIFPILSQDFSLSYRGG